MTARLVHVAFALFLVNGCTKEDADTSATAPATRPADTSFIEGENRAVGLMGRFEFDAATQAFADIVTKNPESADAKVNLAIATLNRQREGDTATAMALIDQVLAREPNQLRARYCKGLLLLNSGAAEEALAHFRHVADADPADAYAAYYVGQSLAALGKHAEALSAYERAAKIDPYLRSAYYGAFQSLQQLKKPQEAKSHLAEFQKLKDHLQARLVEFKYTRMGPKAEASVSAARGFADLPTSALQGLPFAEPVPLPVKGADNFAWKNESNITAADIDGDRSIDLFITAGDRNAVLLNRGETFELALDHPLSFTEDVNAALWGDYDNDGLVDVYLLRHGPSQLWRQTANGKWKDVTEETKTFGGNSRHVAGAFFDADHDGDLDLFLASADAPSELLNNNGNGTFRALGKETGLAGDGRASAGVVVNDFDNDADADILVIKGSPPHEWWLNERFWKYQPGGDDEPLGKIMRGSVDVASAIDTNADGRVELYPSRMLDVDGSGVLRQATFPQFATWEAVVLDDGAGPSIVGIAAGKPMIMRPAASRAGRFMTLSLSGRSSVADQMRSNASGIGVKIAVRVGDRWIARDTYPSSGGAGQSLQPVAIGLGGATKADFVRLTWPDGLMQTELDLAAGKLHRIEETQRQTSSCPVLFAWDGTRYAFVTDVLGVGGIGFVVAPGEYATPRPWENVLLPANLLAARDGTYQLKLTEPMQEACYLDSAALVSYDLPPGWSMTLDERMSINGPAPTGEPRFYRASTPPERAVNDRGEDVTESIASADLRAAPPGEVDARFIGRTREHTLEITFDRPLDAEEGDPMLIIDGWVEYPYSQTMFAAWQAGAAYEAPTLEARGADGKWAVVLEQFGYPAGMPRQMSVPLPREKLPKGTTELRLRTTQEVYWDRIAIAWAKPCPQAVRRVLPMKSSRLAETGFALRNTASQRRPSYDYDRRAPLWDTRHQEGFYTAFGPVDALVRSADDALAIFGPGEEVHLEFAAPVDDLEQGWTRRFVIELSGWCKDSDLYTKDGDTLAPLPHRDGATSETLRRRDALHDRFNTRYRSGGG